MSPPMYLGVERQTKNKREDKNMMFGIDFAISTEEEVWEYGTYEELLGWLKECEENGYEILKVRAVYHDDDYDTFRSADVSKWIFMNKPTYTFKGNVYEMEKEDWELVAEEREEPYCPELDRPPF